MPVYRRAYVPGGTYFFTVVAENRAPILRDLAAIDALRSAIRECAQRHRFREEAFVALPDHLHAIWTLPPGDADYSMRWSFIKSEFTRWWIRGQGAEQPTTESRVRNRRRGVWQRRFWEHAIRDDRDFAAHLDYIHYNAVKHGHAACPHQWRYSSFDRWVAEGSYPPDWCCRCVDPDASQPDFGLVDLGGIE